MRRDEATGGPGAVSMGAAGYDALAGAARRTLTREIADLPGPPMPRAQA